MIKNYVKLIIALVFASNVMAQNVPNYVPKNGLVGYWPFNGNANDQSGNGNHGTVNGATLTTDRNGAANSAYSFDGANNFISLSKIGISGNQARSFSLWVYTSSEKKDYYQCFISTGSPSYKNSFNVVAYPNYLGVMGFDQDFYPTTGTSLYDNNWKYLNVVYINNVLSLYVNGKLDNQFSIDYDTKDELNFFGMSSHECCRNFLKGKLDDIAIYNRALTQQEITALYNGGTQSSLASTKVFVDAPATVNQNQEVEMSISTEALNTADNVIAYQTDLSYDPTRYTYVGSNLTGTLNPNGSVDINTSNNGLLKIGYMSQTALSGAGSLVKLKFKANNTLGQGIFGLSNFMYNNTTITSLKSDTVNTIDGIPPTGRISYSHNPVRKGDSLLITVKFNEKMAVSPIPQLNLSGQNTLPNTNLTKVDDTTYTFWWVVEKGNGAVNVTLATGQDLGGNAIVATPTQNPTFTVLPTLFGDVDTNTYVRAYDAALALQYSVGLDPLPTMDPLPWSNWRIAVANVDTVGNITANDASLILQKSIGKIATFPADDKKRGGDAPVANVSVTQEGNQLVFRTTGTLYAFNVFMKDNFNVLGQPDVKNKSAMLATNINATTYNVGLASTTPFTENEPFLVIPILTNENVQGTMDIVANSQERSLSYGKAAGITAINKEAVIVYPNPTKDIVTINNAQGNTLRIIDAQGKEVYNQKVTTSTMDLSMKTLGSKGMYVLHIVDANNESVQTKQIVLE
jgi:hypothetical protein